MESIDFYQESGLYGMQLVRPIQNKGHLVQYQMLMMIRSKPEWAIPCFLRYQAGQAQICHVLSGYKSLDCVYQPKNLTSQNGINFLSEITHHLINAEDCLLPINQISLHPSHIFYSNNAEQAGIKLVFWPVTLPDSDYAAVIDDLASIAALFNMPEKVIQNLKDAYREGGLQKLSQLLNAQGDQKGQFCSKGVHSNLLSFFSDLRQLLINSYLGQFESIGAKLRHAVQTFNQWLHGQVQQDQPADDLTVLIPADPANFRMAMISAGKPGTPEENEGVRAYILVDEFLLGRDIKTCDLCLGESGIGRQHARIQRRSGSFYITDLGSRNGTRLDGKRLLKNVETLLPDQCILQFADQSYFFQAD
ncbi:MAG TPA: hypothetical protein DCM45_05450 [Clostridiales bacterium]|nr:hypothetical protein [Clostridiales bacterium]